MKVRALRLFNDLKCNKLRKAGEIFEVSEKRAGELFSAHNGTLIEVVEVEKAPKGGDSYDARGYKERPKNKKRKS